MQTYCERCGPGLFDEPINAASNLVFLLAAWAAWRLATRMQTLSAGLWALICLSVTVGVGSVLWHTFATRWAMVLDVVPIMVFQLTFLWLYGRRVADLPPTVVAATLALYAAAALALGEARMWLNGLLVYAPTVGLAWTVGLHSYFTARRERPMLLASAVIFCVALTCRTIDLIVCRRLPIGTHFLWHVLNGLVVYLAMRVLIIARIEQARPG